MTRVSTMAKAAALSAALLLPAAGAHATSFLVVTNFGPGLTFDHGQVDQAFGAGGIGGGFTSYITESFTTPTFDIFFDHIDLALSDATCGTSLAKGVSVDIVPDNGGKPNENIAVVKHWLLTKLPSACGTVKATKLSIPSTQSLTLAANTTYWVVVTPIGFDDFTSWYHGLVNGGNALYSQDGGKNWVPITTTPPLALDVWRR